MSPLIEELFPLFRSMNFQCFDIVFDFKEAVTITAAIDHIENGIALVPVMNAFIPAIVSHYASPIT